MVIIRGKVAARIAWMLVVVCVFSMALAGSAFAQRRAVAPSTLALQGNSTVRVMTRNMDAGTDLNYILAGGNLVAALQNTIAEVIASDIPGRAAQLAREITATKPDLIALQEVTRWQLSSTVTLDQLDLLQQALEATGERYRVAAIQTLTDIPVAAFGARFTDRNAILVRVEPPGQLDVLSTETHLFVPPIPVPFGDTTVYELQGWMAADVKVRGARFKFVNTHLLSPVKSAWETTVGLQMLQASELITALSSAGMPIILAGDFNSDAENGAGGGPDQTLTASLIANAGFTDAWHALHPSDHGFTWGLFLEDQTPPDFFAPVPLSERIDLIFSFGPVATAVQRTGATPDAPGVAASDHLGVVADFSLEVGMRAVARK